MDRALLLRLPFPFIIIITPRPFLFPLEKVEKEKENSVAGDASLVDKEFCIASKKKNNKNAS